MKPRDITVSCRYSEEETDIARIIQSSFAAFLKKELRDDKKCMRSVEAKS